MAPPDELANVFCPTCGRPLGDVGKQALRREADWRGVKLSVSEKYFVGAVVAAANAVGALVILFTR